MLASTRMRMRRTHTLPLTSPYAQQPFRPVPVFKGICSFLPKAAHPHGPKLI